MARDISAVTGSGSMERSDAHGSALPFPATCLVAVGLAAVTLLGALAIPSAAWFVPVLAVAGLVRRARTGPTSVPSVPGQLLYAALGLSIGLAYLVLVIEL
jgi:hypothetical protein